MLTTEALLPLLERANQVAAARTLGDLLDGILALLAELCAAPAGVLYLHTPETGGVTCLAVRGLPGEVEQVCRGALANHGPASQALHSGLPLHQELSAGQAWAADLEALQAIPKTNILSIPLLSDNQPVCVVQLFDCQAMPLEVLAVLAARLASDVQRAARSEEYAMHAERLAALISIFEQIGSTLDRDQLLRMMIEHAREVIDAEACSLFLVEGETEENVLHLASNANQQISLSQVRVPKGKGIIGHVVESGQTVLVPDVSQDARHYRQIDQAIGFVTRAILAVPLRTRTVVLGQERGSISTRVIGGFEAVNKQQGTFDDEDAQLLVTLANQAATVLQIADLYSDANELFLDLIKALAASIDAKDPYTEGHSQRVSDYSVEIARQLNLPAEMVHHVRIGSLLHDVGKIGIPDHILVKPGRLTDDEFHVMKQHPTIGANILSQVRKLHAELPALAEHHERLDGTGYPLGLKGDQISLMGRIVAAADVFDAMTSDRPYRAAMPVEEVLDYLYQGVNLHYDGTCVQALTTAYVKGSIRTQKEREMLGLQ
ncbi:MAG TPA: GAF domain-containing protein [Anaerolineales bacterium]|nr:GAF domain-containing protein [Anaerolineales bacterium]